MGPTKKTAKHTKFIGINLHYQQLRGSLKSIILRLCNFVIFSVASQHCHSLFLLRFREFFLINSKTRKFNNWIFLERFMRWFFSGEKSFAVCNNWRELEFHSLCLHENHSAPSTLKLSSFHLFSFYFSLFSSI